MKKYLAALMTGILLLGSSPVLYGGESTPRTLEEKRMQDDYHKRKVEKKAYRSKYKSGQEAVKSQHKAEMKSKKAMKKGSSGKK